MVFTLFFLSISSTVAAAAAAIYFSVMWKKREIERAQSLAESLGLKFEPRTGGAASALEKLPDFLQPIIGYLAPWRVSGSYRGLQAWIFPETRSYGKSSKTFIIVRVYYREPLTFDFKAARETFFTKLGKTLLNLEDVEVGDWGFDEAVRITASDPAAVAALFSRASTKDPLLVLFSSYPEAFADREGAQWEKPAVRASFAQVPEVLDALAAFAEAVSISRA